jgi:hypothetical protein
MEAMILTAILGCLASAFAAIIAASTNRKINEGEKKRDIAAAKRDAEHECIASIARAQLVRDSERYQRKGWMPHEAKRSYEELYKAYKSMGEDGLIDMTVKAALDLPSVDPKEG